MCGMRSEKNSLISKFSRPVCCDTLSKFLVRYERLGFYRVGDFLLKFLRHSGNYKILNDFIVDQHQSISIDKQLKRRPTPCLLHQIKQIATKPIGHSPSFEPN